MICRDEGATREQSAVLCNAAGGACGKASAEMLELVWAWWTELTDSTRLVWTRWAAMLDAFTVDAWMDASADVQSAVVGGQTSPVLRRYDLRGQEL